MVVVVAYRVELPSIHKLFTAIRACPKSMPRPAATEFTSHPWYLVPYAM